MPARVSRMAADQQAGEGRSVRSQVGHTESTAQRRSSRSRAVANVMVCIPRSRAVSVFIGAVVVLHDLGAQPGEVLFIG